MNAVALEDERWFFGGRMVFGEAVAGEIGAETSSTSESSLVVRTGTGATVGLMGATAVATRGEARWNSERTPLESSLTSEVVSATYDANQIC